MGLLNKTNPDATQRSVLTAAAKNMLVGAVLFFVAFKAEWVEAWRITLPIWLLLSAGVGAICKWQVPDHDVNDREDN